jgi:hypothetical protein
MAILFALIEAMAFDANPKCGFDSPTWFCLMQSAAVVAAGGMVAPIAVPTARRIQSSTRELIWSLLFWVSTCAFLGASSCPSIGLAFVTAPGQEEEAVVRWGVIGLVMGGAIGFAWRLLVERLIRIDAAATKAREEGAGDGKGDCAKKLGKGGQCT